MDTTDTSSDTTAPDTSAEHAIADALPTRKSAIDWSRSRITPGLVRALHSAQATASAAGRVEKRGKNQDKGYAYATADDMIAAAATGVAEADGLAWLLAFRFSDAPDVDISEKQYAGSTAHGEGVLLHAPDGATREDEVGILVVTTDAISIVSAGRPIDKAEAAARTFLSGILARDTFLLARGSTPGDEDVDQRPDEGEGTGGGRRGDRRRGAAPRETPREAEADVARRAAEEALRALTAARRAAGQTGTGGAKLTVAGVLVDLMGPDFRWNPASVGDAMAIEQRAKATIAKLRAEVEARDGGPPDSDPHNGEETLDQPSPGGDA